VVKDKEFWAGDAIRILSRFRDEEHTNMPPRDWDERTRDAWKTAPGVTARCKAIVPFILALIVLATIHVDPTGIGGYAIYGAVMSKILYGSAVFGTGLGGIFGLIGGKRLLRGIEENIGRQQIANFFGIACDQIGLPREIPENRRAAFPLPKVAVERKRDAFGIKERGWIRARINQKNLGELRALLARL
jgi:hypothetical protein